MQDVNNLLGYFECTEKAAFDSEIVQICQKMQKKVMNSLKIPRYITDAFYCCCCVGDCSNW